MKVQKGSMIGTVVSDTRGADGVPCVVVILEDRMLDTWPVHHCKVMEGDSKNSDKPIKTITEFIKSELESIDLRLLNGSLRISERTSQNGRRVSCQRILNFIKEEC